MGGRSEQRGCRELFLRVKKCEGVVKDKKNVSFIIFTLANWYFG